MPAESRGVSAESQGSVAAAAAASEGEPRGAGVSRTLQALDAERRYTGSVLDGDGRAPSEPDRWAWTTGSSGRLV